MVIWVVGSHGMLGSAICRYFEKNQISYIATGREVDITSQGKVISFVEKHPEITHIINCSAYTNVDLAEEQEELAYAVNVSGVENLAMGAKKLSAKMVLFSTDYVFDGKASAPIIEDTHPNPINVYGKTKREGERKLLEILPKEKGLIIRVSWLFGLTGNHFVHKMISLMEEGNSLHVVNDQIGRPTYAEDVAENILSFLPLQGIYHFANKGEATWYDFAALIAKHFSQSKNLNHEMTIIPVSSDYFETKAQRPKYSVLSTEKIERLNILSLRSYQSALQEFFTHYQEEKEI